MKNLSLENKSFPSSLTPLRAATLALICLALAGCGTLGKNDANMLVVNEGHDFAWASKGYVYALDGDGICMTKAYHEEVERLKVNPL